jgi:tetratricopeptide (TPR) repeat protein
MLQVHKAHELDVIKLTENLPQYHLPKGAQGTVVEVFENPEEGYMVEFIDEKSGDSKIADWVLPSQFENVDQIAEVFFKKGIQLLNDGKSLEGASQLREALRLKPTLVRTLHNIISDLANVQDWPRLMAGMKFIIELDPTYQTAWANLAIAFVNYGVQKAKENQLSESLTLFLTALRIETPPTIEHLVRGNIAAAHVHLGILAHRKGEFEASLTHMVSAYVVKSNSQTRLNMALAYSVLAENCLRNRNYEEAINHYTAAEESGMLTTEGLNNRAVAHVHLMQIDEALQALNTATAIDPTNSVAKDNLALLTQNLPNIKAVMADSLRTEKTFIEFEALPQVEPSSISVLHV